MILSCCFGSSNTKQKRRDVSRTSLQDYQSEPARQKPASQASPSSRRNSSEQNLRARYHQERYPPSKKEKRILKQRSQDSLGSGTQRPARCQSELLPSPPETPPLLQRKERHSTIETRNIDSVNVEINRSRVSVSNGKTVEKAESKIEEVSVQPVEESRADDNEVYQVDQVRLKEIEIELLKVDHDLMIQKLKEEHKCALDQAEELYAGKLERSVSAARSDGQEAVMKVTNDANESITRLTAQLEREKSRIVAEHEKSIGEVRSQLKERDEKLSEAFREISEREENWQEEKADVLREVQRLKAEASKMVQVLALEYEEENMSEEKKRSLSAEVYSLQLVVEMRTGEVRSLRDQLASLTHQLDLMEGVQVKLDKANARIEDLQEQLKLKVESEQLLNSEKYQLETTVFNSSRAVERMSQNVEELQWRIRNNYELPVEILSIPAPRPNQLPCERLTSNEMNGIRTKSRQSQGDLHSLGEDCERSSAEEERTCLIPVSQQVPGDRTSNEGSDKTGPGTYSPSSDLGIEEVVSLQEKEQVSESDGNNNVSQRQGNPDGDSVDEGLGDISSEGEIADSPIPTVAEPDFNENDCDGEIVDTNVSQDCIKTNVKSEEMSRDTEKERRPSRISFETPL